MQQQFTKEFMEENCGCYSIEQLNNCSFMKSEPVLLSDILSSEISIKDKYWFVCKKLATKEQNQQIAIGVAEIILPIYEKRYPDDLRPREAIEAAKLFIKGHISIDQLLVKRRAAYDAAAAAAAAAAAYDAAADAAAAADADADAAAAYAADAVYAAAAAAAAYDAAADAAAAAAAAAADAADYAAYAAAAYAIKKQILDFLINFTKVQEPVLS